MFAQFAIVAFIVGSVLGTPIVGEGAMFTIGMVILAADAAILGLSIWKSASNLDRPGRPDPELNDDYSTIANSIISLAVTLALVLIAAIGQKLGKVLVARFPRVAAALESARARIRGRLGIKPKTPGSPGVDVPNAPPVAPEALDYPGRAGLAPPEQAAFDRFIADRRAAGTLSPEFDTRLKAATPDQLRAMARRYMQAQRGVADDQAQQGRAEATNASDPLDPAFAHDGARDGVKWKFNENRPSDVEIDQARDIVQATGEPVTLFGDGYPKIDGVIGDPPRPLSLKGAPRTAEGPAINRRVAVDAYTKAQGYGDVEVHITSEYTVAEVEQAFDAPGARGTFLDGTVVRRVVVWCTDGVYVPTATPFRPIVTAPVRPDTGQDCQPAGVGAPR
jgi:hypothetical protein